MRDVALDDDAFVRGRLGDPSQPYAFEVVEPGTTEPKALTAVDRPPVPARVEQVVEGLLGLQAPHAMTFEKVTHTESGRPCLVGPVPSGIPLSRVRLPIDLGTAASVGSHLLAALAAMHPDGAEVGLARGEGARWSADELPGLVHNAICPAHLLWDQSQGQATLVGFGQSSPAVPRELRLIEDASPYLPPDAMQLGHDPGVDMWAAAYTLMELVSERASGKGSAIDAATPLAEFFGTALAAEQRRRFQNAGDMADAWREAVATTRLRRDPVAWAVLTQAIEDAAAMVGVEVGPREDPVDLGHQLVAFGLSSASAQDIAMLAEVRHDVGVDAARFDEFVADITSELEAMG